MESIDWNALQKVADEAGVGTDLPDNDYEFKVVDTNVGSSLKGKPQIGVQLEVQTGPLAGKRVWTNLTLTIDNPKAAAMFIKNVKAFGVSEATLARNAQLPEVAAEMIGTIGSGRVVHKDGYLNINRFTRTGGAGLPTPPVPGAPPAAAAGAPQFPVPGGAPVPSGSPF